MLRLMLLLFVSASFTAQANLTEKTFCIYDPLGANGSMYNLMQDYKTAAIEWGYDVRLRAYTDEKIAIDDFKAQQCQGVLMTGARARPFNQFAATIEAIGAVPTDDLMRRAIATISSPRAASLMVEGRYEVAGMLPAGPIYLFVRDRNVNTAEKLSGKRIATFEYDAPSIKMVNHVGASVVPSNSANFSGKFNNGSVDVAYAPAVAYKPLEMYRGLANNGAVIRFNLAYLDFQVITYRDQFDESFGQKSRTFVASLFDRAIEQVEKDTAEIEDQYWLDLPQEDIDKYNEMLREVRLALLAEGVYDKRMLTLLRRLRCADNPIAAECVEQLE